MTDLRVKTLAIALCRASGKDPFEPVTLMHSPQDPDFNYPWAKWRAEARDVLATMDEDEGSLAYAQDLAEQLCKKHFPDAFEEFELLDDLPGVLSQIDNMTGALVRANRPQTVEQQPSPDVRNIIYDALLAAPGLVASNHKYRLQPHDAKRVTELIMAHLVGVLPEPGSDTFEQAFEHIAGTIEEIARGN